MAQCDYLLALDTSEGIALNLVKPSKLSAHWVVNLCFRSGKTARKTIADLADGKAVKIPPTIEDPTVYKGVKEALQIIGYALDAPDPVL